MNSVSAVIGANYGDEGKGHVVDYLSNNKTLVIRFNGGAQAGHTVKEPGGRWHVFHHFGSGTFRRATTFLSSHFLVNPVLFIEEHKRLGHAGFAPLVLVDPRARVTTPWDMIVNQTVERARGDKRHGSVGFGVHETVLRNQRGTPLHVSDLLKKPHDKLRGFLGEIRAYSIFRLHELNVEVPEIVHHRMLVDNFMEDIEYFLASTQPVAWGTSQLKEYDDYVFEGAQGLRLDEASKDFPHVTCSKTGLQNVTELMVEAGLEYPVEVHYVTRPYITRHGAGPLSHETESVPYKGIVDDTNVRNEFQGGIRFAYFDIDEFLAPVRADMSQAMDAGTILEPRLAVTCADHVDEVQWFDSGLLRGGSFETFLTALRTCIAKLPTFADARTLVSHGPTRDNFASYA